MGSHKPAPPWISSKVLDDHRHPGHRGVREVCQATRSSFDKDELGRRGQKKPLFWCPFLVGNFTLLTGKTVNSRGSFWKNEIGGVLRTIGEQKVMCDCCVLGKWSYLLNYRPNITIPYYRWSNWGSERLSSFNNLLKSGLSDPKIPALYLAQADF